MQIVDCASGTVIESAGKRYKIIRYNSEKQTVSALCLSEGSRSSIIHFPEVTDVKICLSPIEVRNLAKDYLVRAIDNYKGI